MWNVSSTEAVFLGGMRRATMWLAEQNDTTLESVLVVVKES